MPAFFLALLLSFMVTLAGREQVRVARLAGALGARGALLAAVWLSVLAASALAAWLGQALAPSLHGTARAMFVALVLGLTGLELALLRPRPAPREPTRSLGAIVLVQLAGQFTGATALLTGTMALAMGSAWLAGAGGALGSGLALTLAALSGAEWERRVPLRATALVAALLLLLAALTIALLARGIIA
jgi:hypothetical protein